MRGEYHRGVGMASEQYDWIDFLSPADRTAARRVLDAAGSESTLRRIFMAFSQDPHKKGRPPLPLHSKHLLNAFSLYLRSEKTSRRKIAEKTINDDETVHEGERDGLIRKLEGSFSKELNEFHKIISNPKYSLLLCPRDDDHKFLLIFKSFIDEFIQTGNNVQRPREREWIETHYGFSRQVRTNNIAFQRRIFSRQLRVNIAAFQKRIIGLLRNSKISKSNNIIILQGCIMVRPRNSKILTSSKISTPKVKVTKTQKYCRFIEAFDCLNNDSGQNMPISKIATLYSSVEHFLLDEMQTTADRTKKD